MSRLSITTATSFPVLAGLFMAGLLMIGLFMMASIFTPPFATAVEPNDPAASRTTIRIATFNVSLYGRKAGEIRQRLSDTDDSQARRIACIVQSVRPDILLVNELDYESDSGPAKLLAKNYFAVSQSDPLGNPLAAIEYPHWYSAPSNTGIDSKLDLNHDGKLATGNDAWGYGVYPGQYSMAVYSRFPIETSEIRTFQRLLWSRLPDASRPVDPKTKTPYHPDPTWNQLRLSSKNHIDVPIRVGQKTIHVLASHPTPPVFDGPEDRNGARNHDEIQFWVHYLNNSADSRQWLVDDSNRGGGLDPQASFVVMGDLNSDPVDGSSRRQAIQSLLTHHRTNDLQPRTDGSESTEKTADFGRNGLMRVDYVLPSNNLDTTGSGVFWPAKSDPRHRWVSASDHRLVWIEVEL